MARKTAKQKKAEKQAVKDIIAEQDQEVIKMYNDIAYIRTTMHNVSPEVQATEDSLEQWFETTYPSGGVRASAKGRHHIYQAVKKLRAMFNATKHEMDQFEEVLKKEWAVEQNKIWQERDEYLKVKVKEMNKYCRNFTRDVKKHLTDAELRMPAFADDEASDEDEDTADGDEEEEGDESGASAGEEKGDDAALTDDEDSGNEPAAGEGGKGKAAAPPTPTVEDEIEDDPSTKGDIEQAETEGKGMAAKKKDKKKKKPKRKSKKGKRR